MVELYADITVLPTDIGTRDAIIIAMAGILANFFWHIVKLSWRACFGNSGGESYVTEPKLKHDEQRDISIKLRKELDEALKKRDVAHEERDEALKDRDKYWDERDDYWRQRNEALGERDAVRKQRDTARLLRDRAYEELDKLYKAKLYSDENDKLSLLVLERQQYH
ncbi:hypothetical protein VE01_04388 [Pseudogymnoascus verrucosus]|uniref:Uncharacterized protein n=1 Tax=Pseudogymnoascus verrucosus TaxID=342668 RepID=A0A1B8GNU8_9PEZI|nr:uncharacterized protein VE01_04388 [Pseudogymnoascus verrucosus]OBT97487.1 hypothetical protein VE01_04388 [Pseudogymnoascus verrucosus]